VRLLRQARNAPLAAEVLLYFGLTQVLLLLPSCRFLASILRRGLDSSSVALERLPEARRLARVTERIARLWPLGSRCLQRSLVLLWLLKRRGVGGQLRIGVRRNDDSLVAHAWIEIGGRPVNDTAAHCTAFTPLVATDESLNWLRRAELAS
jgi:hypothetical protein